MREVLADSYEDIGRRKLLIEYDIRTLEGSLGLAVQGPDRILLGQLGLAMFDTICSRDLPWTLGHQHEAVIDGEILSSDVGYSL